MGEQQRNIAIYQSADGKIELNIPFDNDTIWISQKQMSELFEKDVRTINEHIVNIYKEGELKKDSTIRKFRIVRTEGKRQVEREIDCYNLDVAISVGYRVRSIRGTQFRIWATGVLKQYLVDGYAVNEKRLKEKQEQIAVLKNLLNMLTRAIASQAQTVDDAQNLAKVLNGFAKGLAWLDDYDNKTLATKGQTTRPAVQIKKDEYLKLIAKMKPDFDSDVFANPKDESFDSSVNQIYQTFGGSDCYPTLEEKAAMLLYLLVKNHSFTDGNKRIGAACFLYFLERNNLLYQNGIPLFDDATLFALTLLIASSKPEEKDTMKQVILSVLNREEKNNVF